MKGDNIHESRWKNKANVSNLEDNRNCVKEKSNRISEKEKDCIGPNRKGFAREMRLEV